VQASRPAIAAALKGCTTALLVTGCSNLAEHQTLDKYFAASRLRDAVVLRTIATVAFEPRRDGMVQRLRVVSVGQDQRRPIAVPAGTPLPAGPYPGAPDIDRLDRDAGISTPDVASGFGRTIPVAADIRMAAVSAYDPRYDRDLAGARGEITARDVTISAFLLPPQGEMRWETMIVRIARADVILSKGERVRGRWIVTGVTPAPTARTSPAASSAPRFETVR
jgi:hypothetical protein